MANGNLALISENIELPRKYITYLRHDGKVGKIHSNLYHLVKKHNSEVDIWSTRMNSFLCLSPHTRNLLKWGVVKVSPGKTRESLNESEIERKTIETLSQLVKYSKKELSYNGFTPRALNELGIILNTYGLFLKPDCANGHHKEENIRAYKQIIRREISACPPKKDDLAWQRILSRGVD